ncbi:MAG: hypothetical protein RLZZ333_1342, partial [Bacteroidota bacterium]
PHRQTVNLRGQDKVIQRQSLNCMSPDLHRHIPVTHQMQIRMVCVGFCQFCDRLKELHPRPKMPDSPRATYAVRPRSQLPVRQRGQQGVHGVIRQTVFGAAQRPAVLGKHSPNPLHLQSRQQHRFHSPPQDVPGCQTDHSPPNRTCSPSTHTRTISNSSAPAHCCN